MKKRRPGVKRIRLGEVWLNPPCNTFCKMDAINKEHQCRDSGDPLRKPIEGTEKGDLGKEVDDLMREALVLIDNRDSRVHEGHAVEYRGASEMQVVEGVELDMRGMEWFMENPVGMLAMQDYMRVFLETFDYPVVQLTVDYCAWGHFYMKPTQVWTSMVHWVPKGTQVGGTKVQGAVHAHSGAWETRASGCTSTGWDRRVTSWWWGRAGSRTRRVPAQVLSTRGLPVHRFLLFDLLYARNLCRLLLRGTLLILIRVRVTRGQRTIRGRVGSMVNSDIGVYRRYRSIIS